MPQKQKIQEKKEVTSNKIQNKKFFSKPKILLIDLPPSVFDRLQESGFNVVKGTFGSRYQVEKSSNYFPIYIDIELPNFEEQEIIFIDLKEQEICKSPKGERFSPSGEIGMWAKCNFGYINPRPLAMRIVRDSFNRILNYGGIFVLFIYPPTIQKIKKGRDVENFYGFELTDSEDLEINDLCFLNCSDMLDIKVANGKEVKVLDLNPSFKYILKKFMNDFIYGVIFNIKPYYEEEAEFIPLLLNKYNFIIGGILKLKKAEGFIVILPQLTIEKKNDLIYLLVTQALPEMSPSLFPFHEGDKWIKRGDYNLKTIQTLEDELIKLKIDYDKRINIIKDKINKQREKFRFLYGLITETNAKLVEYVKTGFQVLGFGDVRDIDKIAEGTNPSIIRQEDIQIHDLSPTLLIEIKGITGNPTDEDCLQVVKYIPRRMKEWQLTDVKGITIINHKRHIPALIRGEAFTDQQIQDAIHQNILLLTTWDLFKLIKGFIDHNWKLKNIQNLFYETGKISLLPKNYILIGKIEKIWNQVNVYGVKITENIVIKIGDHLGYIIDSGFLEEDIASLQINKMDVEEAKLNDQVGIKTIYSEGNLKIGDSVYKVNKC
ncbi:MAG TPA: hypothetical protein VMV49_12830 [Candidatus Deferrimicrobium sp.]|nr:hypothetical protein [Candidatus Deferrimicrobium sp.]